MILPEIDPTASINLNDENLPADYDQEELLEEEDCGSPEDEYYEQEEDAGLDGSYEYEPNDDILAQQELEDFAQDDCYPEPYDGGDF